MEVKINVVMAMSMVEDGLDLLGPPRRLRCPR